MPNTQRTSSTARWTKCMWTNSASNLRVGPFDSCVRVHWLSLLQEHKTANGRRDLQNAIILIKNPENQGEFFFLQSCQSVSHQASVILVPLCLYEFSSNATWIWMKGDNLSVINWDQLRWGETACFPFIETVNHSYLQSAKAPDSNKGTDWME